MYAPLRFHRDSIKDFYSKIYHRMCLLYLIRINYASIDIGGTDKCSTIISLY